MLKIIKFLSKYWYFILIVIALLSLQANFDLSLPEYTSDIVDTGIGQSGITEITPVVMRSSTMAKLQDYMTDEEKEIVLKQYTLAGKDISDETEYRKYLSEFSALENEDLYILTGDDVDDAISPSIIILYSLSQKDNNPFAALLNLSPKVIRASMLPIIEEMPESMVSKMPVFFNITEYEACGYNVGKIQMNYILISGLKMLGIALSAVIMSISVTFISSKIAAKTGRDLRGKLFKKVLSFSNAEIDKISAASLITRSTNDIQQIQTVIVMMLRMVIYAPILGIGGVLKIMKTDAGMSWIIALTIGVLLVVLLLLLIIAMPKFRKMQAFIDNLNLVIREILTGLPVIRAFSRQKYEEKRFDKASMELTRVNIFTNRVLSFMMPFVTLVMNSVVLLIVWAGADSIDKGEMQVGNLMAFISYSMVIIMSFLMIAMISVILPRAAISAGRIDEVLTTCISIADKENTVTPDGGGKGRVVFENVSFRYPNAEEDVLSDITFTANPGETTAIIGSTGSGKSTLINLLPRFYDVTGGRILIDGIDERDMPQHELRAQIGLVPQKGMLFSGTIESNLRFAGKDISLDEMREAAKIAQAAEFIDEKPEKFDTVIAQGGSNVSGGQKQRLSIARAIAKNPKIYIFDDSFSALDFKTDAALRKALNDKISEATVIIVAQRISTIINAQKIIVLEDGKIAGEGTHSLLLKSCEVYKQIAGSQLSEKEIGMGGWSNG